MINFKHFLELISNSIKLIEFFLSLNLPTLSIQFEFLHHHHSTHEDIQKSNNRVVELNLLGS